MALARRIPAPLRVHRQRAPRVRVHYPASGPALSPGMIYIPGNEGDWDEPVTYSAQAGQTTKIEFYHYAWAEYLSSYGVIVMLINPTDLGAGANTRSDALIQATQAFIAESNRVGSPIYGKLDATRIGVMGHSYGGAGAMMAAASNASPNIKIALALSPVGGDATGSKVPIMMLGGTGDEFNDGDQSLAAGDDLFIGEYATIPKTVSSGFGQILFNPQFDSMHDSALCPLCWHAGDPTIARLGMSFVQAYLVGDTRFQQFITTSSMMSLFDYHP